MATRVATPEPKQANLTREQMREALPRLDKRIADVQAFDPGSIRNRSDPRIKSLETKLEEMLSAIFGHGTVEFHRYHSRTTNLDTASYNMMGTPMDEVIDGLHRGKADILRALEDIKELFCEELSDNGASSAGRAIRAYDGLELHPKISEVASKLFKDGHYAHAIEDAVKVLNELVRSRSGINDKDGAALMDFVFSPSNPILKFNALADESDRNEQRGFMMLFSGAVAGLRNPRAHKIIQDDAESTLEFVAFVSLLAKLVEKARR